jgi:hypothetical protein
MTEEVRTSEEHPDDVIEPGIVQADLSDSEPVELVGNELDDIDFDSVDVDNVPVLEEGADD